MIAKKVLVYTNFDPVAEGQDDDLWSVKDSDRVDRARVGLDVSAVLAKMFAVMELDDNLVITIKVVEDE